MDSSRQHIIKKIAQQLDCGFDCYFNIKTAKLISIPNFLRVLDEEEINEAFQKEIEQVKKRPSDFIKFEALESFESFKIMEHFTSQLIDKHLKSALAYALATKKPFQKFKNLIDHSEVRQEWFDFKQLELEKQVEKQFIKKSAQDFN